MHTKGSICSLIVLGALLGLTGCGSSGSDTTSDTGSQTPPPPPPSGGETITVTGKVTDMPIPNATVMLTVDGQVFQAPLSTDADGNFEVDIESDDPDALVLMEAFDPNGVRFTALLDTFGGFQEEADADGRVADKDITNVTTAHYVLATRAAADGSIDDADELTDTAASVDANAVLELSAAIKLVVENIEGVALPAEYSDTQELAEAIVDGTSSFIDDVETTNPGALNDAVDLVLTDGNATIEWETDDVPGVYMHQDGFSLHAMFADGTGFASSYDRDAVHSFQWSINAAGKLEIMYFDGTVERDVVTLLSDTDDVITVMVEEMGPGDEVLSENPGTALRYDFEDGFTNDNVAGSYSTMGEPGRLHVMLEDHNGYTLDLVTGAQDDAFTWEVSSEGTLWIVDAADGATSQARVLDGAAEGGLNLLVTELGPDGLVDYANVITVARTDVVATSPADVDAADLTLAGNAYAFIDGDQIDVFDFRADGEARQVGQHTRSDGTSEVVDRRGDWSMVDDQTIRIWLEGQEEAEDAIVVDGLGADEMLVRTPEDIAEGTERLVTRIVAIQPQDVRGAYYLLDESGSIHGEFVQMYDNFTGEYFVDGVLEAAFDWSLDERGALVISLRSDDAFSVRTLTLRMLAGSQGGETMRLVTERRTNGILTADPETGRAITVMSVFREG